MKRMLVVASATLSIASTANAVSMEQLKVGQFALEKGVFNTIFAKEMCSCQFVDGLPLEDCLARDNLPAISHSLVNIEVDPDAKTVKSSYKGRETINAYTRSVGLADVLTVGGSAEAKYDDAHPEFGCVLTKLPNDP